MSHRYSTEQMILLYLVVLAGARNQHNLRILPAVA
jgi:hypothetical protein